MTAALDRLRRWLWRPHLLLSRVAGLYWGMSPITSGPLRRAWSASVWLIPREDLVDEFEPLLKALEIRLSVRALLPSADVAGYGNRERPFVRWDSWNRVVRMNEPEPRYLVRLTLRSDARLIADRNARACGQWCDSGPPHFVGETASRWTLWRSTHEPGCGEVLDVVVRGFPRRMTAPSEDFPVLPRCRYHLVWDTGDRDRTAYWPLASDR